MLAIVAIATIFGVGLSSCRRDGSGESLAKVQVLVVERIVPRGKLLAAAMNDGSIRLSEIPGDVAPADAVSDASGLRCLVVSDSLPNGTILRRSFLVEPAAIGLDRGLTDGTTRPQGCD